MNMGSSKKKKASYRFSWYTLLLNPGNARKEARGKEKCITECLLWVRYTWVACSPPYPDTPN
jgi:hypothetical protein